MAKKKRKSAWKRKECGCIRTRLPNVGKVVIRCERHRDKSFKKRLVCYFDEQGIVRRG